LITANARVSAVMDFHVLNNDVSDELHLDALADIHGPRVALAGTTVAGPLALVRVATSGLVSVLRAIVRRIKASNTLSVARSRHTIKSHGGSLNFHILKTNVVAVLSLKTRPAVDFEHSFVVGVLGLPLEVVFTVIGLQKGLISVVSVVGDVLIVSFVTVGTRHELENRALTGGVVRVLESIAISVAGPGSLAASSWGSVNSDSCP